MTVATKSNDNDDAQDTTPPAADPNPAPFIAKIVEAPADDVEAAAPEPIKVPRGKIALVYGGPADAIDMGENAQGERRVIRPGDTVITEGEEADRLIGIGGFTEYEPPESGEKSEG